MNIALDSVFTHHHIKKIWAKATSSVEIYLLKISKCCLCGGNVTTFRQLCDFCYADFPRFNYQQFEGNLLNWPPIQRNVTHKHIDYLFALSPYLWPFDDWLKQLKYAQRFEHANLLAELLASQWKNSPKHENVHTANSDVLFTPVAIHPLRWCQRGYNQSHLIAKQFCRISQLPYDATLVHRIHQAASQVGQSGSARRKQLRGAFAVSPHIKRLPSTVFIIDDVVTTGTTVNEIARVLKQNGVKYVGVIAVALSLPQHGI